MTGNEKSVWQKTFVMWLPFAIIIVIFSGLVYAAVQQNYRQTANDPLYQINETLVNNINQGQPINQIVPAKGTTELANSVLPFVLMYNATGTQVGSSALLDGQNPSVPTGVLEQAKAKGDYAVTWQPKAGVREAVVVKYISGDQGGYIVAGRSLKDTEARIQKTLLMSEIAALAALVLTFVVILFFVNLKMKSHMPEAKKEDEMKTM